MKTPHHDPLMEKVSKVHRNWFLQATRARLIAGWTPDGVNLWSVGKYGIIQHSVDGGKRGPCKIAARFQNYVLFGVLSKVALFNGYDGSTLWRQSFPFEKSTNRTWAQYAFRITYGSSQPGKTLQRMHSQHEAREKIFALNLYLRKKANKPSFFRAKVEGEFRTTPRFRVGDGRPGGMQVQDRDELIAKAREVAEGPHDYAEFPTRLAVRLGDAQLAGNGIAFVDDVLLE